MKIVLSKSQGSMISYNCLYRNSALKKKISLNYKLIFLSFRHSIKTSSQRWFRIPFSIKKIFQGSKKSIHKLWKLSLEIRISRCSSITQIPIFTIWRDKSLSWNVTRKVLTRDLNISRQRWLMQRNLCSMQNPYSIITYFRFSRSNYIKKSIRHLVTITIGESNLEMRM